MNINNFLTYECDLYLSFESFAKVEYSAINRVASCGEKRRKKGLVLVSIDIFNEYGLDNSS